jgi:hypothetical protein
MAKNKKAKESPETTPDVKNLTPEQAAALIQELQAKLAKAASEDASVEDVADAKAALVASAQKNVTLRKNAGQGLKDEVYEVKNLLGATIFVAVSNARGEKEYLQFENKGSVQYLTAAQIAEVQDATPYFKNGFLGAPGMVETNDNMIEDYDKFVQSLDADKVTERVAAISNADVLLGLYNHLETKRWKVEGTELVKQVIDTKSLMVLHAVADRASTLTGINISLNDAE